MVDWLVGCLLDWLVGWPISGVLIPRESNRLDRASHMLSPSEYCVCLQLVNIVTNQCVRRLGVIENTERFLHVALFQGAAEV